jgi:hypothetical protein
MLGMATSLRLLSRGTVVVRAVRHDRWLVRRRIVQEVFVTNTEEDGSRGVRHEYRGGWFKKRSLRIQRRMVQEAFVTNLDFNHVHTCTKSQSLGVRHPVLCPSRRNPPFVRQLSFPRRLKSHSTWLCASGELTDSCRWLARNNAYVPL